MWVRKYGRHQYIFLLVLAILFSDFTSAPAAVTYSFNNAGASGQNGPTQAQINTTYSGTSLQGLVTINTQGIQEWVVPNSGLYQIDIAGAKGGNGGYGTGGAGAFLSLRVSLTSGDKYAVVVGQVGVLSAGGTAGYAGGSGGGGTFIYRLSDNYLVAAAAGGGGGAGNSSNLTSTQSDANGKADTNSGTSINIQSFVAQGGTNGNGGYSSNRSSCGTACNSSGAGAGFFSSGATSLGMQGRSRTENWLGGTKYSPCSAGDGGFGGGGGVGTTVSNSICWSGGGGGYSGGGSGGNGGSGDSQYGGGGGSYYTGTLLSSTNGSNTGNGYLTITYIGSLNSNVSLSLASNINTVTYRSATAITAAVDQPGTVTFYNGNKKISGCIKVLVVSTSAICTWKPAIKGPQQISATLNPNNGYNSSTNQISVSVISRTSKR